MKKVKWNRLSKFLATTGLSFFSIISIVGISSYAGNKSYGFDLNNRTNEQTKSILNESTTNNSVVLPKVNDTNGKTLVIGKNIIRLNNKVIYVSSNENSLISASVLTVYDENFNRIQEIYLDSDYDQMSPIDSNDVSKGIVISSWNKSKAFFFKIDSKTQTIIEKSKSEYDVPINAYHVAANFDLDNNGERNPVIISISVAKSNIDKLDLLITSIETKATSSILIEKNQQGIPFDNIKLVDCISINDKLYIGVNLYKNNKIVGSNLILLKDGKAVPGGPTFDMTFAIKCMSNDNQAKKLYVQYEDINDHSIRLWFYNTSNVTNFGQASGGTDKASFSQMITVTQANKENANGIITLGDNKSDIKYYNINNLNNYQYKYTYNFLNANSSKISDLIYNSYTNKFNLFYSYNSYVDGVVSWSFDPTNTSADVDDESLYTNIAPVHIRYADYLKLVQTPEWSNEFASIYAKNNYENNYDAFLEIPSYYKELQKASELNRDNSFEIKTDANDNIGTFNLVVNQNKKINVDTNNSEKQEVIQTTNLLNFNVSKFVNVNPEDIKLNIDYSSPLLKKSPTELNEMLNNPETNKLTNEMLFNLLGIDKKYEKLDHIIKINGYNVLGNIDIQITFPTVSNTTTLSPISSKITSHDLSNVNKFSTVNSSKTLKTNFNIAIEKWFIPVVATSALVFLVIIGIINWYTWGRRTYENYLIKSKKELLDEYEPLKILIDDENMKLEDNNGKVLNPMMLASTIQINMNSDLPVHFREESHFFNKKNIK
ncbi:hypothetical protein [Mycoplasmoides pirum]|uniref:hypothetical protein n=1 Tax=Mycoplasmoides pirum TaxID=2122 RepID=UPI0004867CAD|nr:hypothetical protein [Mycoplasmoides pirum]